MTDAHAVELDAPDNEIPVALAVNLVLGRGPDVVIFLPTVYVYATGMQLQVQAKMRQGVKSLSQHPIEAMCGRIGSSEDSDDRNRLLLGAKFPDGQSAVVPVGRYSGVIHRMLRDDPQTPSLTVGAGVGGPFTALVQYWLRPLPTGSMILLCSWASAHIEQTQTVISGTEIADAARRVVTLWPR